MGISAARDEFDPTWYAQTYPDVRKAGLDPWEHFNTVGRAEGRLGAPVQALSLDQMLWRGYADMALPALRDLMAGGQALERAAAGWVLARWELEQQNLAAAYQAIKVFHADPEGAAAVSHPGPYLLGLQLSLRCDDLPGARAILRAGLSRFSETPDFVLAQILCAQAEGRDDATLSALLRQMYQSQGLSGVGLAPGPQAAFDRLQAVTEPKTGSDPAQLPLVSVIIPVFNGADGLPTALRGVQAQTWPRMEILAVDDGSDDDSLAIAHSAAAQDPRIRVIAQECNQGAYPARNAGFAAAQGAFITVHDADDWSHPQKIECQARTLMEDPALKASVSHWVRAGNSLEMTRWRMEEGWIYRNVSSLMLRAELRDDLGYWDRVKVNADTEYYYRLIRAYGPAAISEVCPGVPLAFGRTAPASLTNQSATHLRTQFQGVRRDYMEAAHAWHERATTPADLYLPQHPACRPFRVPDPIGLGDPQPAPGEYDVLAGAPELDEGWYRLANPDVLHSEIGAARHYLISGAPENRDPGPGFSTGGYRRAQGLAPDENPLLHYMRVGRAQGADPLPCFPGQLAHTLEHSPRVLIFAHSSGATLFGAERSLLDVVRRMGQRGLCPVVVVPTLRNMEYLDRLLEISAAVELAPQLLRHALRAPDPATVARMQGLIRKYVPREIHVNTMVLEAPLLAARAEGVPSVMHLREMPGQDQALCRSLGASAPVLRGQLLEQADRFIVPSQPVADWLDCPTRVKVRPNSVDEGLFDLPFAPGQSLNVALISSNIAKKGVGDFLAVARIVGATGRPVRFLLIGPPTQDLHLLQPLPDNVDFRDYAATPQEAVAQADLVLSLSQFAESFGRTVLESMAAGRPVICYDRGAPPSLVRSGQTGFVVPADTPQAVANAVLALEAARGQLHKMGAAARLRARQLQEQAMLPG